MQRENVVATAVGLLAAALVFAVMFWLVDAGAVYEAVRGADLALLAVVAAAILLWNVSWGVALWFVLRALDVDVAVHTAVLVQASGAFANHVTPFGQAGGEPVTAWVLSKTAGMDYEVSLASITSLDAVNTVPSLSFATVGALYYLATATALDEIGLLLVGVLAVAVGLPIVVALGWWYRDPLGRRIGGVLGPAARRVARRIPRLSPSDVEVLAERVTGFTDAVGRIAVSRELLVAAIACSAVGWSLQSVGLWVTFLALDSTIPVVVPFFVLPIGKVGDMSPTPGGLGGTEAINVTLLALLTAASAPTIVAAVTIHSVGGYLLTTSVGAAATSVLGVRG